MNNIDWLDSLLRPGTFMVIILGTLLVAYIFRVLFNQLIRSSTRVMKNDPTSYKFMKYGISFVIYVVGFSWAVYEIPQLRTVANSLLAGAGILAVALGFASQHALKNIISGMFIVIFKPFKVNDRLKLNNGMAGIVEDISLRHTVIRDFENRKIIIPNSIISEEVIVNADFENDRICKFIEVRVPFHSNIDHVKTILREEVMKHPFLIDVRSEEEKQNNDPVVRVRVLQIVDNGILLRAWAWAHNAAEAFVMGCDVYESLLKRFDEENIRIPYPHVQVVSQPENK